MRIKTVGYVSLILIPCLLLAGHMVLIKKGYCYETGKFFSELDYKKIEDEAIERVWRSLHPKSIHVHGDGYDFYDPIIPYKDVMQFKEVNPECCYFTQKQIHPDVHRSKLSGDVYGYFILKYWIFRKYSDKIPNNQRHLHPPAQKEEKIFVLSTCGSFHHLEQFF